MRPWKADKGIGALALAAAGLFAVAPAVVGGALQGGWQEAYPGGQEETRFYPDANARYWTYELDRGGDRRHLGLRVRGRFPAARYMSLTLYDNANYSAVAGLADVEISPEPGARNPFAGDGAEAADAPAGYTVYVLPQGAEVPGDADNLLTYDDGLDEVALFLRYYLPRGGPRGGQPLPRIEAFDTRSGSPAVLPQPRDPLIESRPLRRMLRDALVDLYVQRILDPLFALNPGEELQAYRVAEGGLYANPDNEYLVLPIRRGTREAAVIRFRPPRHAGGARGAGAADVRYWSMSLGDDQTYNRYTLADFEASVAEDGFVYLVLGDPAEAPRGKGGEYNFIPWDLGDRGMLIYRNLLTRPGFEGAIRKVPRYEPGESAERHAAGRFIGDYAPRGRAVGLAELRARGPRALLGDPAPAGPCRKDSPGGRP